MRCPSPRMSNLTHVRADSLSQVDASFYCLDVFNLEFYSILADMDENIGMNPEQFHFPVFSCLQVDSVVWTVIE